MWCRLALADKVGEAVRGARVEGAFPIVLTGNCFMTVGAVAGLSAERTAVMWFDAHGDLNTPATSISGFIDGMAAAALLGWCHSHAREAIARFAPIPANRLILVGARSLDPGEEAALAAHAVQYVPPQLVKPHFDWAQVANELGPGAVEVHVHIDLDVLDADAVGRANSFACSGGLTTSEVVSAVSAVGNHFPIAGLTIAAYDPAVDENGAVLEAALHLIEQISGLADGGEGWTVSLPRT